MSKKLRFIIISLLFLVASFAFADEYTSTNYKVLEPVMFSGGYSFSTGYQLFGAFSFVISYLSTDLLTAVFAFANLIIVNPPRAYFGRCGVLYS